MVISALLGMVLAMPAWAAVLGDDGPEVESLFDLPIGDLMEVDVLSPDAPVPEHDTPGEDRDPACDPPRPDCEPLELWPDDLPDPGAGSADGPGNA